MTDIVERLHTQITSDHVRGCMGREYSCTCGYDAETEKLLAKAAEEIERLQSQFNVTLAALESANDEVRELRAEIERLRADNERLRGELAQWRWGRTRPAALEHKP